MKLFRRVSLMLAFASLSACAGTALQSSSPPQLAQDARWVVAPFSNYDYPRCWRARGLHDRKPTPCPGHDRHRHHKRTGTNRPTISSIAEPGRDSR